jgi:hypothetical protein
MREERKSKKMTKVEYDQMYGEMNCDKRLRWVFYLFLRFN